MIRHTCGRVVFAAHTREVEGGMLSDFVVAVTTRKRSVITGRIL